MWGEEKFIVKPLRRETKGNLSKKYFWGKGGRSDRKGEENGA